MISAEVVRCRPWLEAAVEHSPGESLGAVVEEILSGRAQLWGGRRSCLVTQLTQTPEGRIVHGWLCGGDRQEVLGALPMVESWARQQGAEIATVNGRKGWARALKPQGYTMLNGLLRKVL